MPHVDYEEYRASDYEKARTEDLLRLLPRGRDSILDIGARDGHFSRLLTGIFPKVTALDLRKPEFEHPGVETVAGDATRLDYPDNAFDVVFCAEVLEHIPDVERACRELLRVARYEIVIGVPYRQDIRLSRTTCRSCGTKNPPWGHVNSFDDRRLCSLFAGASLVSKSFVGKRRGATNGLSVFLMDLGGNPWGTYSQEEPCIHCGASLQAPSELTFGERLCSAIAFRANWLQTALSSPRPSWVHMVFAKAT